jgi:hypothetical protein
MINIFTQDPHRGAEHLFLRERVEDIEVFMIPVHEKGRPGTQGEPSYDLLVFVRGGTEPGNPQVAQDNHHVVSGKKIPGRKNVLRES